MDRRRFLLTSLAGALAVPLVGEAQEARKVARIGYTPPPLTTDRMMHGIAEDLRSYMPADPLRRYVEAMCAAGCAAHERVDLLLRMAQEPHPHPHPVNPADHLAGRGVAHPQAAASSRPGDPARPERGGVVELADGGFDAAVLKVLRDDVLTPDLVEAASRSDCSSWPRASTPGASRWRLTVKASATPSPARPPTTRSSAE